MLEPSPLQLEAEPSFSHLNLEARIQHCDAILFLSSSSLRGLHSPHPPSCGKLVQDPHSRPFLAGRFSAEEGRSAPLS